MSRVHLSGADEFGHCVHIMLQRYAINQAHLQQMQTVRTVPVFLV